MTWRQALGRIRRDWPGKVVAIVAALVLWWVASNNPATTAQRSLLVPLQVIGTASDEVPVGVPPRVEVVMSGASVRMDRLRADDVDAVLDLTGASGEFSREVEARAPAALQVERVVPNEVIGRIEAVRRREFEVQPRLSPAPEGEVFTAVRVTPARAVVEARDPVLAEVAAVVAWRPGDPADGEAVLVPTDAEGRHVDDAQVVPETATLEVDLESRLVRGQARVELAPLPAGPVRVESVAPEEVALLGPPGAIANVEVIEARVPDATFSLQPGRYDLALRLALPDGVLATGPVTASVRVLDEAPDSDQMRGR